MFFSRRYTGFRAIGDEENLDELSTSNLGESSVIVLLDQPFVTVTVSSLIL